MRFTLNIELGNEAMKDGKDIGRALSLIGRAFSESQDGPEVRDAGKIKDINGNTVGSWEVTETPAFSPAPKLPSALANHLEMNSIFQSLTLQQTRILKDYVSVGDLTSARSYLWSCEANMSTYGATALVDWLVQQNTFATPDAKTKKLPGVCEFHGTPLATCPCSKLPAAPGICAPKPQENRKQETEPYRVEEVRLYYNKSTGDHYTQLERLSEEASEPNPAIVFTTAWGIYQRQPDGTDKHLADFGTEYEAMKVLLLLNSIVP